ncbi:hypothetical protein BC831DRAFT_12691 [Entophlyctis helioformis]|nr:hypothetical protein BC831DRAFT_12691 [Entophlyctis helioformis]
MCRRQSAARRDGCRCGTWLWYSNRASSDGREASRSKCRCVDVVVDHVWMQRALVVGCWLLAVDAGQAREEQPMAFIDGWCRQTGRQTDCVVQHLLGHLMTMAWHRSSWRRLIGCCGGIATWSGNVSVRGGCRCRLCEAERGCPSLPWLWMQASAVPPTDRPPHSPCCLAESGSRHKPASQPASHDLKRILAQQQQTAAGTATAGMPQPAAASCHHALPVCTRLPVPLPTDTYPLSVRPPAVQHSAHQRPPPLFQQPTASRPSAVHPLAPDSHVPTILPIPPTNSQQRAASSLAKLLSRSPATPARLAPQRSSPAVPDRSQSIAHAAQSAQPTAASCCPQEAGVGPSDCASHGTLGSLPT